MKQTKKILAFCFCVVAIAALLLTGCVDEIESPESPQLDSDRHATASDSSEPTIETNGSGAVKLGVGKRVFSFSVIGANGAEEKFEISTDQKTVGAALVEVGLIEGEQSEYGLFIKSVNGEALDFEADGKYWAFYIDDDYAITGVDSTDIDTSKSYALKAES